MKQMDYAVKKEIGFYSGFVWGVAGDASITIYWDGENFLSQGYGNKIDQYESHTAYLSEIPIDLKSHTNDMVDSAKWTLNEKESGYYVCKMESGELTVIYWSDSKKEAFQVGVKEGYSIEAYKAISESKLQFDGENEVCSHTEWERRCLPAQQSDLEKLVHLYTDVFGENTWRGNTKGVIRASLGQEIESGNVLLSYDPKGEVTGFATFLKGDKGFKDLGRGIEILTDNTTVVTEVGVSEKHREAGIAEFLVDQVYESAKENEEFKFFVYSDESIKDVNRALRHRTYTKNCEMKNLYERID